MSDYLKRLVRRAVPAPYFAQDKMPEVRPATSLYRRTNAAMQQDFELEGEESVSELDATRPFPNRSPISTDQPPAVPDQPGISSDPSESGEPQNPLFRSRSDTVRGVEAASPPDSLDIQPTDFAPGSPPPVIKVLSSTQINDGTLIAEQADSQDTDETIQRGQADVAPFSGNLSSSPVDRPEAVLEDQTRPVDPMQPHLPKIDVIGQVIELDSMPHLEPQIPSPVETGHFQPEFERVKIGSLTVEVLPASPPSQEMQRVVQITQVVQPAPPRHSRSSKLRFGLGQM